ncbi:MAG TPA: hypothetical protein VGJ50_25240 [Streptosporangiaceae bacterium]|jgi:hypothetical protein
MEIGLLVVAATVLDLAAGAGLAYVVGFGKVRAVLGVFRVDEGPRLPRRELLAVAIAGFGGHLAHGGGPLD